MPHSLQSRNFLNCSTSRATTSSTSSTWPRASRPPSAAATRSSSLKGKEICLIFEKTSTRTRCSFEVAAYDQGAHVTYLDPGSSQMGHKESVKDTARVLGRLYDGIEYRGFDQKIVQTLADFAGVPGLERPDRRVPPDPDPRRRPDDEASTRSSRSRRSRTPSWATPGNNMGNSLMDRRRDARHGRPARRPRRTAGPTRRWSTKSRKESPRRAAARITLTDDVGGGREGRRLPLHRRLGLDGRAARGLGASGSSS